MTEGQIREKLRAFVVSTFMLEYGRDTVDPGEDLLSSGFIDSMGVMEAVGFVEETLGVRIDDDDIVPENFRTLRALTELVLTKKAVVPVSSVEEAPHGS
jgi:acyl carrier protein